MMCSLLSQSCLCLTQAESPYGQSPSRNVHFIFRDSFHTTFVNLSRTSVIVFSDSEAKATKVLQSNQFKRYYIMLPSYLLTFDHTVPTNQSTVKTKTSLLSDFNKKRHLYFLIRNL